MRLMTPAKYVDEIVIPTVREFREDRRSRPRAYLACIATYHVKDHLAKAGVLGVEQVMLAVCCDAFQAVKAVCNASKHVGPDRDDPLRHRVGDDIDRPPAIVGEMRVGISRIGDETGGREVGNGANSIDIYEAVRTVLNGFIQNYPLHLGQCDASEC
jgi:hypothetical protein